MSEPAPQQLVTKRKRGRPVKGKIPVLEDLSYAGKGYRERYKRLKYLGMYLQQLIDEGKFPDPGELVKNKARIVQKSQ